MQSTVRRPDTRWKCKTRSEYSIPNLAAPGASSDACALFNAEEERRETGSLKTKPSPDVRSLRPQHACPRAFGTKKQQPKHLLPTRSERRTIVFRELARGRPADEFHPWPRPSCVAIASPEARACRATRIPNNILADIART